jgi:hypothetical protein
MIGWKLAQPGLGGSLERWWQAVVACRLHLVGGGKALRPVRMLGQKTPHLNRFKRVSLRPALEPSQSIEICSRGPSQFNIIQQIRVHYPER